MNKTLALLAAIGVAVAAPAFANEAPKTDAPKVAAEKVVAPAATHAELKDGTKIVVKGEEVFVVGKDGKETPAPDAKHELKDGQFVTTKGGKIVK